MLEATDECPHLIATRHMEQSIVIFYKNIFVLIPITKDFLFGGV